MAPPDSDQNPPALYFDEDSSSRIVVKALRAEGYDVLSTPEADNGGNSDKQQLKFAASKERVLFSFNRGDFKRIHKNWWKEGINHFGIVLAIQQRFTDKGLILQLQREVLEKYTKEDMKNQIFWLT